jgi:hypothetical protein
LQRDEGRSEDLARYVVGFICPNPSAGIGVDTIKGVKVETLEFVRKL